MSHKNTLIHVLHASIHSGTQWRPQLKKQLPHSNPTEMPPIEFPRHNTQTGEFSTSEIHAIIPPLAQQNANNTKRSRIQRYRPWHWHKHWKSRYSHKARLCTDTTEIIPDEHIATRDSQHLISFRSHKRNHQRK